MTPIFYGKTRGSFNVSIILNEEIRAYLNLLGNLREVSWNPHQLCQNTIYSNLPVEFREGRGESKGDCGTSVVKCIECRGWCIEGLNLSLTPQFISWFCTKFPKHQYVVIYYQRCIFMSRSPRSRRLKRYSWSLVLQMYF